MTTPFAKPSPLNASTARIGYDNKTHYVDRRVSLSINAVLMATLRVTLEARGVALTVFCRYWDCDEGTEAEHVRLEHRLTKPRFRRLVDELVDFGLVEIKRGKLYPSGPFSADQDGSATRATRSSREMPSDWIDLRDAVFERDRYGCVYCGSGRDLHCDHVHPVARGGGHEIENLVTSCATCNLSKGSKSLSEWRPDLAEAMGR